MNSVKRALINVSQGLQSFLLFLKIRPNVLYKYVLPSYSANCYRSVTHFTLDQDRGDPQIITSTTLSRMEIYQYFNFIKYHLRETGLIYDKSK